jgi:N-acetylmuramoyl-L-alanine amidase
MEIVYKLYPKAKEDKPKKVTETTKPAKKDTVALSALEPDIKKTEHIGKKKKPHLDDPLAEGERKRWELDVIVLDPGHGGKDAGCISINGYQEKDIALKIAKELRGLINQNMPETKVVMTRSDDTFIELYRRGQIANESHGKLFISIHINAARTKPSPAKGFETYILRPGRNDDAIKVANKENAVVKYEKKQSNYKALTEEEMIIVTMAQSTFVKFSELFARTVQEEVSKTTPMFDRGVNQAGFLVLVGASMPNVLFEAGFASNTEDESYLISKEGQHKIALGLYNAIQKYSEMYENSKK